MFINPDSVSAYVKELAGELDTVNKPKKVITSYGKTINVESKGYGWKVNQAAETEAIKGVCYKGDRGKQRAGVFLKSSVTWRN